MSHSPEPWSVGAEEGSSNGHIGAYRLVTAADGSLVGHLWPDANSATAENAARILACVNACRGIPTETLRRCVSVVPVVVDEKGPKLEPLYQGGVS